MVEDNNKKNFIREKIIGRNLSKEQAAKHLILAAACGLAFGVTAATTFYAVDRSLDERHAAQDAALQSEAALEAENAAGAGTTGENAGGADAAGDGGQAASPGGDAQNPSAEVGLGEQEVEQLVRKEQENYTYTQQDYQEMMDLSSEVVAQIDQHIVAVNAVSNNETWFDESLETSEAFAGLILSVREQEVLILTTEHAVDGGTTIKVKFPDGAVQTAAVKQVSRLDDLAVIAVSKAGIGEETLSRLTPVTLGSPSAVKPGDLVIAAGAPLSQVHSYDFGRIGYVGQSESTVDGSRDLFYTHVASNLEKGTFLMDIKGELIGAATLGDNKDYTLNINTVRVASISWLRHVVNLLCDGVSIPYIGIYGTDISFDMKYSGNIPEGVYVTDVVTDSPAYQAGLRRGDIVTGLNDTAVKDYASYNSALQALKTGENVKITAKRNSAGAGYRDITVQTAVGAR